MVTSAVIASGLDGVVVADTAVSEVDGERGKLIIRGVDAEELGFASTFEETCALLWTEPSQRAGWDELQKLFAEARVSAFELVKANQSLFKRDNAMDALRTATSLLDGNTTSSVKEFARVTAAAAVFAAAWRRTQEGKAPIAPDKSLSHSADFLKMLNDKAPSKNEAAALDTYLTTVSDHGMNASTFTARVVASTASDNISCIVAAIGALKGPLHGGAPGPVLEMLSEIATPENAEAWLNKELDSGKRIMGMGHRIYKVRDPRAAIFEKAIRNLEEAGIITATRLSLARAVEKKAEEILAQRHPERPLKANVEFYTAVLLDAIKIPHDLFSATFAAGRAAGWCAHIAEQRAHGRLIRPASKYVGPNANN